MLGIMGGLGPQTSSANLRIFHIQDIQQAQISKAQELQQVSGMKMIGTNLSKKEDRMRESAKLMIKAGSF
jgi:hypothetical protein